MTVYDVATNKALEVAKDTAIDKVEGTGALTIEKADYDSDVIAKLSGYGPVTLNGTEETDILTVTPETSFDLIINGFGGGNLYDPVLKEELGGGAGDDVINGGAGADRMTGNLGKDVFVFGTGKEFPLGFNGKIAALLHTGDSDSQPSFQYVDKITDFSISQDTINFIFEGFKFDFNTTQEGIQGAAALPTTLNTETKHGIGIFQGDKFPVFASAGLTDKDTVIGIDVDGYLSNSGTNGWDGAIILMGVDAQTLLNSAATAIMI